MRTTRVLLLVLLTGGASVARSQEVAPPATQPGSDASTLIRQLGDADFHVRRDASNRLRAMGAEALPDLKRAINDPNPEIRARAGEIVHVLEFRHVPGRPANHIHSVQMKVMQSNGQRSIDVNDCGRHIEISDGVDGIRMTVTGELDGRPAKETYNARSPEQLKSDNPEAYAVYQRYVSRGGSDVQGGVLAGNVIVGGNGNVILIPPVPVQPMIRGGGDNLVGLRATIESQMDKANVPPGRRQQIKDALDEVEQARQPAAGIDQTDQNIRNYDLACDKLRKSLAEAKLPDPGEALPPPKGARLGISVAPDLAAGGGLLVSHVVPASRADRIGLQEDDRIRKINGTDVGDVKDLRRLVTDHAKGLVLDITRDGRDMKLQEK